MWQLWFLLSKRQQRARKLADRHVTENDKWWASGKLSLVQHEMVWPLWKQNYHTTQQSQLWVYPAKNWKQGIGIVYMSNFITVIFILVERFQWQVSIDKWMDEESVLQSSMEYSLALKKDILTHGTIMNFENSIVWNTGWFFCEEPLTCWTHRNSKELEGRRNGLEMRNGLDLE